MAGLAATILAAGVPAARVARLAAAGGLPPAARADPELLRRALLTSGAAEWPTAEAAGLPASTLALVRAALPTPPPLPADLAPAEREWVRAELARCWRRHPAIPLPLAAAAALLDVDAVALAAAALARGVAPDTAAPRAFWVACARGHGLPDSWARALAAGGVPAALAAAALPRLASTAAAPRYGRYVAPPVLEAALAAWYRATPAVARDLLSPAARCVPAALAARLGVVDAAGVGGTIDLAARDRAPRAARAVGGPPDACAHRRLAALLEVPEELVAAALPGARGAALAAWGATGDVARMLLRLLVGRRWLAGPSDGVPLPVATARRLLREEEALFADARGAIAPAAARIGRDAAWGARGAAPGPWGALRWLWPDVEVYLPLPPARVRLLAGRLPYACADARGDDAGARVLDPVAVLEQHLAVPDAAEVARGAEERTAV